MANAQIVQHLQPGGIESLALNLLDSHPEDWLIALEGKKVDALRAWPRLQRYTERLIFLEKPPKISPSTLFQLMRCFKEHGINSIHTHHIGPYLYGAIAARSAGITKHVHTEHDGWHLQNAKHSGIQRVLNQLFKPTLVADAMHVARMVQETTGASSQIIYNGVDTSTFTPCSSLMQRTRLRHRFGMDESKVWIGSAGRLEIVKGHADLIRALALLPEIFHLVIAGTGSELENLQGLSQSLKIEHRVKFVGHLDNTVDFYRTLDIFCLPSLNEGFPLAPLEAQACNIRAVVTEVGGSIETLCPVTGISTPSQDPIALAKALTEQYLSDPDVKPRAFVQENFSLTGMTSAYRQLLSA